jgi:hypothetical protein
MLIMIEEKKYIKIGRMSSILCFEWAHHKMKLIIFILKKWFGRFKKCFYYE